MVESTLPYILLGMAAVAIIAIAVIFKFAKRKKKSVQSATVKRKTEWTDIEKPLIGNDPSVANIKKFTITADISLIAAAFAGFVMLAFAYLNPQLAIFAAILGSVTFLPIGALIGGLLTSSFRIKIVRRIGGKNYGFIKFIHANRLIKPVIVNLDNDMIRFGNGVYFIENSIIRREGSPAYSTDKISESSIKFEEGIPTIYFDVTDILPVDFQRAGKTSDDQRFRNPAQVAATLNKEISVEKAKVMRVFKGRQDLFMIIILGMSAITAVLAYLVLTDVGKMSDAVAAVKTGVDALKMKILV